MTCLPLYRKEMRDLPQIHPEVYNEFMNGNFHSSAQARLADADLTLEQIYHKEGKTTFLQGVTQKNAARKSIPRQRAWVLKCRVITSREKQAREDLALVETMTEKINEKFVNPFRSTNKTDVFNIVTGEKAISTDMAKVKVFGQ